jgi:glycosyltransferase involved in cell wall biosynthesis
MKISVIVPNHGRDIENLTEAIERSPVQEDVDVEIIFINHFGERSRQRNIGINAAKGDYFLILDSDQSISPGLLMECCKLMKSGYSCVYIPEVIIADSFFGRIRAFERQFYTGTAIDVPRFVRRDCCPMFDENMIGPEDADWGNRIEGFRATSKDVLYHHDDISFREYCRKKAYYTKSMRRYAEKWPGDPCLDIKYRCWTVFVEKGKWRKLIRHPVLAICIIFIILVRGVIYVSNK